MNMFSDIFINRHTREWITSIDGGDSQLKSGVVSVEIAFDIFYRC